MHLELSDEQALLREAAAGILSRHDTRGAARAGLDGQPLPSLWGIACDAGWPGLLIGEDAGGAGLGAYEAMLVLEACGTALADAGLAGHLAATAVLEQAAGAEELRAGLAEGRIRAALVDGAGAIRATPEGARFRLKGSVGSVLDAPAADVLVVVSAENLAFLVRPGDGVEIRRQRSYDATRNLGEVVLVDAGGEALEAADCAVTRARDLQQALLAAEAVGAAAACLAMALDYAIDRHAFGRAIGSYQAIKHKLVEMLRRIEGGRSLLAWAGRAWHEDTDEFGLAAHAARVAAADALDYAAPENIFIHGGIGATWEHDAQLYYRRAEVSRRLAGGAEQAADALAGQLFARMSANGHGRLEDVEPMLTRSVSASGGLEA